MFIDCVKLEKILKTDYKTWGVKFGLTEKGMYILNGTGWIIEADNTKITKEFLGTVNKTTVDSELSSTSTNPVQNKAVQAELTKKAPIASPSFTGTPKVPTASAGTNNTQAASTAFVTSAISTAMAGITKLDFQVVQTLPSTGVKGTFYLIANSGRGQNVYDEYLWINNKYEKLGTREIDLSSYIKQSDMVAITNSEIDAAFA